jgi:UDP-2-acetamido-3-amino-2,3-dideoxy-glucuronate N-acetyltransferase
VVTKDVPDYAVVVGNPARWIGWMCECGVRLEEKLLCPSCQRRFRVNRTDLEEI